MWNFIKQYLTCWVLYFEWKDLYSSHPKQPDIRELLKFCLYYHQYSHCMKHRRLLKKAEEQNFWCYVNHYFPFNRQELPQELSLRYFPYLRHILLSLFQTSTPTMYLTAQTHTTSLFLMTLVGIALGYPDRKVGLILPEHLYSRVDSYLQRIRVNHPDTGHRLTNIRLIRDQKVTPITLTNLKDRYPVLVGFIDGAPLSGSSSSSSQIKLRGALISVNHQPLASAIGARLPVRSLLHYSYGKWIRVLVSSVHHYNSMDMNPQRIGRHVTTHIKMLSRLINRYPSYWLPFSDLNDYHPIFRKKPSFNTDKHIIHPKKHLPYISRSTTYILNLENGSINTVYTPAFKIIRKSKSRRQAARHLTKVGIPMREGQIDYLLGTIR